MRYLVVIVNCAIFGPLSNLWLKTSGKHLENGSSSFCECLRLLVWKSFNLTRLTNSGCEDYDLHFIHLSSGLLVKSNFKNILAATKFPLVCFLLSSRRTLVINLLVLEWLSFPSGTLYRPSFLLHWRVFVSIVNAPPAQTIAQASLVWLKESSSARLFVANNRIDNHVVYGVLVCVCGLGTQLMWEYINVL